MISKRFVAFLGFFLCFFALGVYFYHLWKYPSPETTGWPADLPRWQALYPEDILLKTGAHLELPKDRSDHFLNFSLKKQKGARRLGAFGDSYTYGTEVLAEASWPSHLQRIFDERQTLQKTEVLNFGMGGHSFQEQYFLWERYAREYGIDYILYGPAGLYADRDLTFHRGGRLQKRLYFPKERFVLSGGSGRSARLRLVSLKGASLKARYKNYYRLIPSFRVLRYDRRSFPLWEWLFPFLNGRLGSPFYYSGLPPEAESAKINQILLGRIKTSYDKKILFFTDKKRFFDRYRKSGKLYNLNLFDSHAKKSFLYQMLYHASSLGNEIAARVYFHALMGKKKFALQVLSCRRKEAVKAIPAGWGRLNQAQKIFIGSENQKIGELRLNSSDHYWRGGSWGENKPKAAQSLLGFFGPAAGDFGQPPYFPLPFELRDSSEIQIEISPFFPFSKAETILLGKAQAADALGGLFHFYSNYTETFLDSSYTYRKIRFIAEKLPAGLREKLLSRRWGKIRLLAGGHALGRLELDTFYGGLSFVLKPAAGDLSAPSFLMMGPSRFFRASDLPLDFPLYIHYLMEDGQTVKSRFARSCQKKKRKYRLALPRFQPLPGGS